jgi:hypothetical protein
MVCRGTRRERHPEDELNAAPSARVARRTPDRVGTGRVVFEEVTARRRRAGHPPVPSEVRPDEEWTMGSKGNTEMLTQQIDEVRDRAADLLASDGGSRDRSAWPTRTLWLGLGVVIGAAAAGGRLLRMLPTQLANRLEGLIGGVASATTGMTEKVGSLVDDTTELVGE